jgi:hypothetical protein
MEIKNTCIKCNTETTLKRYCRQCIALIKESRLDKEDKDKCKCGNCRCFKPLDSFIAKKQLLTCLDCRIMKNPKKNKNEDQTEQTDTEQPEIKILHKQKYKQEYKHKLTNILQYLKTKYNILETIEDLQQINITEQEDLETHTTTEAEED